MSTGHTAVAQMRMRYHALADNADGAAADRRRAEARASAIAKVANHQMATEPLGVLVDRAIRENA